ncbi:hypothetical protein [Mobiluncus mulieris]|uniref:hypothetical protein n=1 Tax=Mobiluncus mulieris TaxID=2052 RepID=UPI001FD5F8F7|nr:hypothetical protein [Mobiluncus mulieris]
MRYVEISWAFCGEYIPLSFEVAGLLAFWDAPVWVSSILRSPGLARAASCKRHSSQY